MRHQNQMHKYFFFVCVLFLLYRKTSIAHLLCCSLLFSFMNNINCWYDVNGIYFDACYVCYKVNHAFVFPRNLQRMNGKFKRTRNDKAYKNSM